MPALEHWLEDKEYMKKLLMVAMVMGLGSSMALPTVEVNLTLEECNTMSISDFLASYKKLQVFPNPKSYTQIYKPFSVKCPDITFVSEEKYAFTIKSESLKKLILYFNSNIKNFIHTKSDYDIVPKYSEDFEKYRGNGFIVSTFEDYSDPKLREGRYSAIDYISFFENKITYSSVFTQTYDTDKIYFSKSKPASSSIVGYKINNGPLKEFVYNQKTTDIIYHAGDIVDIFFKDMPSYFKSIKFDTLKNQITFYTEMPFPSE